MDSGRVHAQEQAVSAPLVLSLSPRAGGNSETAARLFAASLTRPAPVHFLRDYEIRPCTGCGACADSGRCVLADRDDAERLFSMLEAAPGVALCAPVYFYHLPAQAKAWVDRAQSRYAVPRKLPRAVSPLPAWITLIAGRPRGEKLFAGILPTLRYFLEIFHFRIADTVLLRGLDGSSDLARDAAAGAAVARMAKTSGF